MRKVLLTVFLLCLTGISFSQWTFVSRPLGGNIWAVSAVGQTVVWIACDSAKVLRSTNAGASWDLRNAGLPSGNISAVSALDSLNCWIGTFAGSIYRTTNGGLNWSLQFSQSGSFADGIKMFNSSYGIYYGDPIGNGSPFQIRYTTNGGTDWILTPNTPISQNDYGVINAWDWLDTGRIWLGAANATPSSTFARIFRTTTGVGSGNWSSVTVPSPGTSDGMYWQAIAFVNANNGLAGSNGGTIRRTTDGGANWTLVSNPPGLGNIAIVNLNSFKDGSNLIRMSTTGANVNKIFRTTDIGASWTEEALPTQGTQNKINHIQFVTQTLGYAVCNAGYVLRFGNPSAINLANNETPDGFELGQNYPNPFNPATKINFSIPFATDVSIKLYDMNGKEVSVLLSEYKAAGNYSFDFNAGSELSSGVYLYTMNAGEFTSTRKLLLVK